jgi:hypothetical protein
VALFRKSVDPELQALRDSIRRRGAADLVGASRRVDEVVGEALARSGVDSAPGATEWLRDRLRLFLVMGTSPWLSALERLPDEYRQLEAEFRELVTRPERFGPRDIVAWWWNLDRRIFEPLLENQFPSMIDPLAEGLAAATDLSEPLGGQMVDWTDFFK